MDVLEQSIVKELAAILASFRRFNPAFSHCFDKFSPPLNLGITHDF